MRRLSPTLVAIFLAGCTPSITEIVVVVDSDIPTPAGMDRVEIRVTNDVATTMVASSDLAGASHGSLPATVGVRPAQDTAESVTIVAAGMLAGTDVVTSEVRTHFIPGRRVVLQIFLADVCRGVTCPHGMTCHTGTCVSSTVDPSTLPPFSGHLVDAGMDGRVVDAGVRDTGPAPADASDAGGDAGPDTGPADAGCPSAMACDDGVFCNGSEQCLSGACVPGVAPACDDLVDCTTDACSGACTHTPNDGACTAAAGGHCDPTSGCQYPTCDATTCHDDTTTCTHAMCAGSTCMRTSACMAGQTCCGGACVTAGCDDMNVCTDDSCGASGCVHAPNTNVCDDGSMCSVGDVCSGGGCAPGPTRTCNDGNLCTTDTCDPATGCQFTPNTSPCDDGNVCTTGDRCASSICSGMPATCDDGVACTDDSCGGSGCTHVANDAECTAMPSGTCSATLGCQYPTCTMASCPNDPSMCLMGVCAGPTCTHVTTCSGSQMCCGGACVAAGCDDGNPCTTDSCLPGGCTHVLVSAGTPCPGGVCVLAGMCCTGCVSGGVCQAGTAGGMCGNGGNTCSSCPSCSAGICAGGDCASPIDISGSAGTYAIDTCAHGSVFDFGTCSDSTVQPTGVPEVILEAGSSGGYTVSAGPGWTVGSLSADGMCHSGFISCSTGEWSSSGSVAPGHFFFAVEKAGGGCGRVTITVGRF